MMRLVFALVAVVSVLLVWQWYAGDPGHAGSAVELEVQDAAPSAPRPVAAPGPGPTTAGKTAPTKVAKAPEDALIAGIDRGDQMALAGGFARLQAATGSRRARLANALAEASERAADIDGISTVLGQGNAFLHSPEGRALARKALQKILAQPAPVASVRLSGLLERCLAGRIGKADQAAFDLVNELYERHKVLVDRVVFNPANLTKARTYKVKPDDVLDRIAARYRKAGLNVEGWTLCYVNRLGRPNRLQAGKTIKIPTEPIWAKVDKASFSMAVYVGSVVVRLYWIGHGKEDRTPVTTFTVATKQSNPDWYAPDGNLYPFGHPKNVLGRYFVKFAHESLTGFGAHGTAAPETIRTRSSLGCIRMGDDDVLEFFRFVPRGARIVIVDSHQGPRGQRGESAESPVGRGL